MATGLDWTRDEKGDICWGNLKLPENQLDIVLGRIDFSTSSQSLPFQN